MVELAKKRRSPALRAGLLYDFGGEKHHLLIDEQGNFYIGTYAMDSGDATVSRITVADAPHSIFHPMVLALQDDPTKSNIKYEAPV